jgi:CRISPR-associated protein Csy3
MAEVYKIKRTGRFALPPNLSFRRSIEVSDGLLSSVMPTGELRPVQVTETTVRGAMGNSTAGYGPTGAPLEGDALAAAQNPSKPNIQTIDRAQLDTDSDTLDISFSMAFHGGNRKPDACSREDYRRDLELFLETAVTHGLYEELAARYLWNVVNGRILWRNAYGIARGITLEFDFETMVFDWSKLADRREFPGVEALVAAKVNGTSSVEDLIARIASALRGESGLLAIDVSIRVQSYHGAEVWPSQEFVEKSQARRNDRDISRILASRHVGTGERQIRQGVMHSQKIGNAVRTIDEWHGDTRYGAVPVEAFGWVQSDIAAIRAPAAANGIDAYRGLESVGLIARAIEDGNPTALADGLYVLAVMCRGGVWGVSEKQKPGNE